jgi:hypothetical protein
MSRDGAIAMAVLFIIVLIAGAIVSAAHAHGDAAWIEEGGQADKDSIPRPKP